MYKVVSRMTSMYRNKSEIDKVKVRVLMKEVVELTVLSGSQPVGEVRPSSRVRNFGSVL